MSRALLAFAILFAAASPQGCRALEVPRVYGQSGRRGGSQSQSKPVLWVWSSDSCMPCRMFWRDYFNDAEFAAAIRQHFAVKRLKPDSRKWPQIKQLPAFWSPGMATTLAGYTSKADFLRRLGIHDASPAAQQINPFAEPEKQQPPVSRDEGLTQSAETKREDQAKELSALSAKIEALQRSLPGRIASALPETVRSRQTGPSSPDPVRAASWFDRVAALAAPVVSKVLPTTLTGVAAALGVTVPGGWLGWLAMRGLLRLWRRRRANKRNARQPATPAAARQQPKNHQEGVEQIIANYSGRRGGEPTNKGFPSGDAAEAESVPVPRDLDEARQILQLGRLEGRVPELDCLTGMFVGDVLDALIDGDDEKASAVALKIRTDLERRINEVAPVSTKGIG